MSIFKKKSKAEKEKKSSKQDSKKESKKQAPEEEKPAQAPYKHVPKHAAADAVPRIPHNNDNRLSREANEYANGAPIATNDHPYTQSNGRNNPLPPYRGFNGGFNAQRNKSAEIFTTAPDAPPLPSQSPMPQYNNQAQHNEPPRSNNGYFSQQQTAPSFDSPMLGNPKMTAAARDRGYINPHNSADSGYGSVGHSRAPSEQGLGSDCSSKPHLPRDNSGFLPELSLSEELAREPAFSEASFGGGDEPLESATQKQPESVLKNRSSMREVESGKPSRLSKSYRIQKAKQARFEHTGDSASNEEMQPSEQHNQLATRVSPSQYLPEPVQEVRPESATLPQQQHYSHPQPVRSSTPTFGDYDVPRASESRHSMLPSHRGNEQQTQAPARVLSPLSADDHNQQSLPMRFASSPPTMHQPAFAPLTQINSVISMVGLDGLKVNKRGKVLDEEGDVIGELVEGDIMDCVRQKCNAYGEVLDDRGRIVGRVQTIERSIDSPIARIASPALYTPPITQPQQYFPETPQRLSHTTPSSPVVARSIRRESAASQRETFTPAWQRQAHPNQSGMARELRDHMAAPQQPTQARDLSQNVGAVELEAPGSQALDFQVPRDEEEVLPIFDYSDVFMPPMVPERSSLRAESPPEHKQKSRPQSQQPETSRAPVSVSQPQAEISQKQARHVSAPLVSQAYQAIPYARSQQPDMQAEAQEQNAMYDAQNQPQVHEREPMTTAPAQGSSVAQWAAQLHGSQQQAGVVSPPASRPASQNGAAQTAAYPVPSSLNQFHQRPPVARNASEISMSDMAKSYSRPTMSPVPEDGSPIETKDFSSLNGATKSPALFSYKGDIPAAEGPQSNAHLAPSRAIGVKSPPLPTFPKQAFTGGLPGGSPFAPMKSAQFSSAGGLGNRPMPPRQFSTGVPGPRSMPGLQTRNSVTRAPLKRSPLSSQENSPPDSDQGSNDGHHNIGIASGGPSRQQSLRSMRSTATNGKPRTYFTHGGRVTVDEGQMTPAQLAAAGKAQVEDKEPTPSVMTDKSKKKSRFSIGFGKKDKS